MLTSGSWNQFPRWCIIRRSLSCAPFEVSRSVKTVQSEFHKRFKKDAPYKDNVTRWYRRFAETGCLCKGSSPGRPRVSDDNIERVREAYQRSRRKSVARASRELGMPKMTVWKVLRKQLCFKPNKMRLVQAFTPADRLKRCEFCEEMQLKMREDGFVERLISDEAIFHIHNRGKQRQCPYLGNGLNTRTDRAPA
jgi:transposase